MNLILKAKHWQVFLILLLTVNLASLFSFEDEIAFEIQRLFSISVPIIFFFWLGSALNQFARFRRSSLPPLLAGIFLIVLLIASTQTAVRDNIEWWAAVPLGLLGFASFFALAAFPASVLKSIELNEEVDINDYLNYLLLFVAWPLGIWYFQPRINKLISPVHAYEDPTPPDPDDQLRPDIDLTAVNRAIGYGILVFVVGYLVRSLWTTNATILIPIGSLMALWGSIEYLRKINLKAAFRMEPKEGPLTYFWNVIVLKFWTAWFLLFMLLTNLGLIMGWPSVRAAS